MGCRGSQVRILSPRPFDSGSWAATCGPSHFRARPFGMRGRGRRDLMTFVRHQARSSRADGQLPHRMPQGGASRCGPGDDRRARKPRHRATPSTGDDDDVSFACKSRTLRSHGDQRARTQTRAWSRWSCSARGRSLCHAGMGVRASHPRERTVRPRQPLQRDVRAVVDQQCRLERPHDGRQWFGDRLRMQLVRRDVQRRKGPSARPAEQQPGRHAPRDRRPGRARHARARQQQADRVHSVARRADVAAVGRPGSQPVHRQHPLADGPDGVAVLLRQRQSAHRCDTFARRPRGTPRLLGQLQSADRRHPRAERLARAAECVPRMEPALGIDSLACRVGGTGGVPCRREPAHRIDAVVERIERTRGIQRQRQPADGNDSLARRADRPHRIQRGRQPARRIGSVSERSHQPAIVLRLPEPAQRPDGAAAEPVGTGARPIQRVRQPVAVDRQRGRG